MLQFVLHTLRLSVNFHAKRKFRKLGNWWNLAEYASNLIALHFKYIHRATQYLHNLLLLLVLSLVLCPVWNLMPHSICKQSTMRHWLSLGTWMKCINYTLCTSFILFFGGKKQRLLIAQSTRSVILCAIYIVYIIRYWHLSGHLTLHAAQCKHFKCQFMQLFCSAIDENQFAQAAKRKWNGKAERQKNKSRTSQDTNNNKLAACDTEGG